jgi:type VI secretion system secreted protein VgrG
MPIDDAKTAAGTAAQIARGLLQQHLADRIEPVSYEVEFHDLDGDEHQDWRVRRFFLSEGLSQCYEATLDILNTRATANSDELLGQQFSLHITRAGAVERLVHGVVDRVEYIGVTAEKLMVRIHVVPAFRLLSHRTDCRIFPDQSVPEILETVIKAGLGTFEREVELRDGLTAEERDDHYPKRDYCVQYNESDLDFVTRLMEEEGITFFFEHDPEQGDRTKELLVLVDQRGDNPNAGCPETVIIDPDDSNEVPMIADRPDTADTESIQSLDWCQSKKPLKVHERGFNWKTPDPAAACEGTAELEDDSSGGAGAWEPEVYIFGDRHKTVDAANDDAFNGTGIEEFGDEAVRCLELFKRQTQEGKGRSNVVNFSPGYWFALRDHPHDDVNEIREFLITSVTHSGDCPDVERQDTDATESMGPRYENKFDCIPRKTKFRPAVMTPKPRIYGPQTATVTGSGTEEIHTDQHGRIRVRFHWDRVSPVDDTASCWVRVAQAWAGPGWGTLFIPRVGMEVVVEFLQGNPDNPLVTGCVYNGTNAPPYTLPDDRTKSTIKTNSYQSDSGFNELRFEDATSAEEIFLHAQKDFNEVVKNNHTTRVGANQTHTVGGDRVRTVKGSETITIEGNQSITINGVCQDKGTDGGCGVKGKVVTVDDTYKLDAMKDILFTAPNEFKLSVLGSTITVVPGKIEIIAGGGASLVLDENITALSNDGSKIFMSSIINQKASTGSQIILAGDASMTANDKARVLLTAEASVAAAGSGGSVTLTASDAKVAAATVTLNGKSGSVKADAGGVNASGPNVSLSGKTEVSISGGGASGSFAGGIVKLN